MIGFIWETLFCSFKERKLVNRGFMKGPFLPIYGSGVCVMLVAAAPFSDNILLACFSGMICATVLEYVTGDLMDHLFKVRYWDYSEDKFNLRGYICLGASLGWFVATFVVREVLQRPVEKLMHSLSDTQMIVADSVVMGIAVVDFVISFKAAMDLRSILVKMDAACNEMKLMQKRLDVMIALTSEDVKGKYDEITDAFGEKYKEFTEGMEERFDHFENGVSRRLEYLKDNARSIQDKILPDSGRKVIDELKVMKDRYSAIIKEHASFDALKSKIRKLYIGSIFRSNPSLTSDEYKETLEDLKSLFRKK